MLLLRDLMAMLLKAVLGAVVLGCIGASGFFAFEFGSGKAAVPDLAMTYGLASAGLDLLKASLPLLAASAIANRQWSRGTLAWVAFAFLTAMSLWCAFGTTAGQLAERFANKVVAQTAAKDKADKLARLHTERDALGTFTRATPEAVASQQAAINTISEQVRTEAARGSCKEICRQREADERTARALLVKMQADQATTAKADELDKEISDTEAVKIDVKVAAKDVDPQAASLSQATGIDEAKIALVSHIIFAIGIEIGSGLGLWLVFGHGFVGRRKETEKIPPTVTSETDEDARLRFFQDCVAAATGKRVSAATMHGAYSGWCAGQGRLPMTSQAFGKDAPWPKEKVGGSIYYLNCAIGARARPSLHIVA